MDILLFVDLWNRWEQFRSGNFLFKMADLEREICVAKLKMVTLGVNRWLRLCYQDFEKYKISDQITDLRYTKRQDGGLHQNKSQWKWIIHIQLFSFLVPNVIGKPDKNSMYIDFMNNK